MSPPTSPERHYSLRKRLALAFGVLLVLFLGLAGLVLGRAYQESVAAGVEERLQLHVYALLGVAEPDPDGFIVPDLGEARFGQIDSGLYAFILDRTGREVWRSPSALNLNLANGDFDIGEVVPGQMLHGTLSRPEHGAISWASYGTYWEIEDRLDDSLWLESTAPIQAQFRWFQSNLSLWVGALAVCRAVAR